jgi:hypothetical protein
MSAQSRQQQTSGYSGMCPGEAGCGSTTCWSLQSRWVLVDVGSGRPGSTCCAALRGFVKLQIIMTHRQVSYKC